MINILDQNEVAIASAGGLEPLIHLASNDSNQELQAQAARALRNLSVHGNCVIFVIALIHSRTLYLSDNGKITLSKNVFTQLADNKARIIELGGVQPLRRLAESGNDRIRQQASRALINLGESSEP